MIEMTRFDSSFGAVLRGQSMGKWRYVFLMVMALIVLCVTGCSKEPAALFEEAKARASKGDRSGAIILLKDAIQKDPQNGAMRFMLGRLYNEVYDAASAEKELRKAVELGTVDGGRVAVELARALRLQAKFEVILRDVEPKSAYEPEQLASIHALRGRAQQSLGRNPEAKESLVEAQKLGPQNADAVLLDAQIRFVSGESETALAIVDSLVGRVPTNLEALTYRAGLLRQIGRVDDAMKAYADVLKILPTHYGSLRGLTVLLTWRGDVDDAQRHMNVLKQTYKGHPQVIVDQGVIDYVRKKYDVALAAAQTALKARPDFLPAQLLLGLSQQALGDALQAEQSLTKYVAADPSSRIGRYALAAQLLSMDHPKRAADVLAPMLKAGLDDPGILVLAGDIFSKIGELSKAMDMYEKASARDPERADARVAMAFTHLRSSRVDVGLDTLEGALKLVKRATPSDEMMVMLSLARGDLVRANRVVDKLEKDFPTNPITHNLRGLVLLAAGKIQNAVQAFENALARQPSFFPAAYNLARLDLADGNLESARKRYGIVLAAQKNDLPALMAMANIERQAGRRDVEEAYLERAIKANPSYIEPRRRLVASLSQRGDKARATELADNSLAASPDDADAIVLAAETHLRAGNSNRAIQIISRLESASKSSPSAQVIAARIQMAAGRGEDAEASLRRALQVDPGYEPAQRGIVGVRMMTGSEESAIAYVKAIQKAKPRDAIGFVLEAEIHEAKGRHAEALVAYRGAQARAPADGGIATGVYRAMAAVGRGREGIAELEKFVDMHPRNPHARAGLGFVKYSSGDYAGAAEQYELLVKAHPSNADGMNGLAWVYHKLKNPRARAMAEAAFAQNPDAPQIHDTLGFILLELGENKRGYELIKYAAAALPDDLDVQFHLALALSKIGDAASARERLNAMLATPTAFSSRGDAEKLLKSLRGVGKS